jgi:hypothetical protein
MTFEEKMSISERAMQTARDMTDQKVALSYLKKIGLD